MCEIRRPVALRKNFGQTLSVAWAMNEAPNKDANKKGRPIHWIDLLTIYMRLYTLMALLFAGIKVNGSGGFIVQSFSTSS